MKLLVIAVADEGVEAIFDASTYIAEQFYADVTMARTLYEDALDYREVAEKLQLPGYPTLYFSAHQVAIAYAIHKRGAKVVEFEEITV